MLNNKFFLRVLSDNGNALVKQIQNHNNHKIAIFTYICSINDRFNSFKENTLLTSFS